MSEFKRDIEIYDVSNSNGVNFNIIIFGSRVKIQVSNSNGVNFNLLCL
ncbi:hypothetical protein CAMRE0001_1319 [Campylobacter rectus RM3267]|uniref:Uncharacterized protein n=1 Tax=Campylobacter rectus RM3267 TaxID=553218 RepID=B9D010_CAMRE|nr:hypothetical protein CAMRE0001_1319 [Campylobacter rectus RM3267]